LRSILVATDFSDDAVLAVTRAARLACLPGVQGVQLLHVVDTPGYGALRSWLSLTESSQLALLDEARRALAAQVQAFQRECGRDAASRVMVGPLLDSLVEAAADADLLVIGAHGQHPVRDIAIGSTAERLLRKRRRAVLVVRAAAARPYQRVLVPVDFSRHAMPALRAAATIAPDAQLDVLHVFEVPFEGKLRRAGVPDAELVRLRQQARAEAVEGLGRLVRESGVDPARIGRSIVHGYAPRVIIDAARTRDADLIVIGKHGESLAADLLLGSVTLHVLGEARCDVLVVSARPRRQSSNGSPT